MIDGRCVVLLSYKLLRRAVCVSEPGTAPNLRREVRRLRQIRGLSLLCHHHNHYHGVFPRTPLYKLSPTPSKPPIHQTRQHERPESNIVALKKAASVMNYAHPLSSTN